MTAPMYDLSHPVTRQAWHDYRCKLAVWAHAQDLAEFDTRTPAARLAAQTAEQEMLAAEQAVLALRNQPVSESDTQAVGA